MCIQVNSAFIYVEVWDCGRGQSNVTSQQCSTCLPNQFSVNNSKICHPCPTGALCSGGVTLVPQNGSWHSSAVSDYMVSCPNPDACQRDITALQACQNLSYVQELPAALSQVRPFLMTILTSGAACVGSCFTSRGILHVTSSIMSAFIPLS